MTQAAEQAAPDPLAAHFPIVVRALVEGRVVPFLGAGVNLCGRPEVEWKPDQPGWLPNGKELARHVARHYPDEIGNRDDLLGVAQYVATMDGAMMLYADLRGIFDADYPATAVHRFFAQLPARLRLKGCPSTADQRRRRLLIVTTNYDDVLERAFARERESFHVVTYMAAGAHRGKFLHFSPSGDAVVVHEPETYTGLRPVLPDGTVDEYPVILKIHGAVDREQEGRDSYVITEDDYIDYLTRSDLVRLLPNPLPAQLQISRFLFLGYRLQDWNLRAMIHRLWSERSMNIMSWAILKELKELERRFWMKRDIDIIEADLEAYFDRLDKHLGRHLALLPDVPSSPSQPAAES
jgi:hypothetical protein